MGKFELSARLTVVRRLGGQASIAPSAVRDQSMPRTNFPISPPPTSQSWAGEPPENVPNGPPPDFSGLIIAPIGKMSSKCCHDDACMTWADPSDSARSPVGVHVWQERWLGGMGKVPLSRAGAHLQQLRLQW